VVLAPPRAGYAIVARSLVIPAPTIDDAARELAAAYRDRCEVKLFACPTPHRRRELHPWERARLIELATAILR
jgi:hypothetical protein